MPHPSATPACATHARDEQHPLPPSASLDSSMTWATAEPDPGSAPSSSAAGAAAATLAPAAPHPFVFAPIHAPAAARRVSNPSLPKEALAGVEVHLQQGPVVARGVVGLANQGNTCYLNAAMQLLLACEPFMAELQLQQKQKQGAQASAAALAQVPPSCPASSLQQQQQEAMAASHFGKGPLGSALQEAMLHASDHAHGAVYTPNALLAAVRKCAPALKGRQQQDSHEVLHLVLEGLEAEERRARQAAASQLTQQQAQADQGMSLRGGRVLHASHALGAPGAAAAGLASRLGQWVASPTLVERVFGGRLASAITCCSCGFESVSSEPFLDLSLPLPQQWLGLPDQQQQQQHQRSGSGGGRDTSARGAGQVAAEPADGGRAKSAACAAACSVEGLLGSSYGWGPDSRPPAHPQQQGRGRHKRKSMDEPCFVPFVSPVPLTPPPAAATVMHGWAVHATGQRACPSSSAPAAAGMAGHGAGPGAGLSVGFGVKVAPPPSGSSSDLPALPCADLPIGAPPAAGAVTVTCTAAAAFALGAAGASAALPVAGVPAASHQGAGAREGARAAPTSSTSSNCSSQQQAGNAGTVLDPQQQQQQQQQGPVSPTAAAGAVTRAKARRLCDPGGLSEQLGLAAGAGVGVGQAARASQISQGHGQEGVVAQAHAQGNAGPGAALMDIDAGAVASPRAHLVGMQGAGPQPQPVFSRQPGAAAAAAAAGTVGPAAVPVASEGSSRGLSGQLGRLWVGAPNTSNQHPWPEATAAAGAGVVAGEGKGAGLPHVRLCLAEFFQEEDIHWDCPRDSSLASAASGAGPGGGPAVAQLSRSAPAAGASAAAMQMRQPRRGAPPPAPLPSSSIRTSPSSDAALEPGASAAQRPPRSRGTSRTRPPGVQPSLAAPQSQQQQQPQSGRHVRRSPSADRAALGDAAAAAGQQLGVFQIEDVGADNSHNSSNGVAGGMRRRTRRPSAGPAGAGMAAPAQGPQQQGIASPVNGGRPTPSSSSCQPMPSAAVPVATRSSGRLRQGAGSVPAPSAPIAMPPRAPAAAVHRTCTAHRATKSYRLDALPPVLLLHLKRFRRDDSGAMRKVGVHVGFDFVVDVTAPRSAHPHGPMQLQQQKQQQHVPHPGLGQPQTAAGSLGNGAPSAPHCSKGQVPTCVAAATAVIAAAAPAASADEVLPGTTPTMSMTRQYDLVGLVEHIGTMKSGHYVAYVSRRCKAEAHGVHDMAEASQQWYCVSDTSVRPVAREQVLRAQAYMLMYVQRPCQG